MKFPDYYDYDTRECKICKVLLQPDVKFVEQHADDPFHIKKMLEQHFGGQATITKEEPMDILNKIQKELKAPKNQRNNFGNYNYRSCEDILEAVKPLLGTATLILSDDIVLIGDRFYVKATVTLKDADKSVSASAFARESLDKKGMDTAQITGAASSYARKYALNGLFCIDDTKDADTQEHSEEPIKHTSTEKVNPDGSREIHYKEGKLATEKQIKFILNCADKNGVSTEEVLEQIGSDYGVERIEDLTTKQASELIDSLQKK